MADRRVKGEISEEERPLLMLIANVIAQIAIGAMNSSEEIENYYKVLDKTSSSKIKTRKPKK